MQNTTKYVGLDVSKEMIAVAVADSECIPAHSLGNIPNTPEAVRKMMKKIGEYADLKVCYEAGPTGYGLYRQLHRMGISCLVAAPSLIPRRPGDRVKTDRRDALRLAQLLRAGELTAVWVPTEDDEALRDLVRARQDAKEDLLAASPEVSVYPIGGINYVADNNYTFGIPGVAHLTNDLYADFNENFSLGWTNYVIWDTYGMASSYGLVLEAQYDGDAHTIGNDGPHDAVQGTFTDKMNASDISYSNMWTEDLVTNFDGYTDSIDSANSSSN